MVFEDLNALCVDNDEVLGFLQYHNLLLSVRRCDKCQKKCKIGKRNDYFIFRCKICYRTYSAVARNSILSHCHLPYQKVLEILYFFLRDFTFAKSVQILGVSENTLVVWHNSFREVCENEIFDTKTKVGGPGKVVEVEESVYVKRKYYKGGLVRTVICGIERGTENCFVVPVTTNRNCEAILEEYVKPQSTIMTDKWEGYKNLDKVYLEHLRVNHFLHFEEPKMHARTNATEGEWAKIKSKLPIRGRHDNIFHSHLCAYLWKKKNEGPNIFLNFMEVLRKQNSKEEPDVRTTLLKVKQFNSVYNKNKTSENTNTIEEPKINNDDKLNDNNQTDLDK